ncbi:DUF2621 domain-containing protein [Acinetobacter sp. WU_MDCI_Axc73]|nr:DUF2621 domain-containing protein [Acinetobacter sp. WU_MDCI_Axc73]
MKKIQIRLSPSVWFILLWCFGFVSLALIAGFFRLLLSLAY